MHDCCWSNILSLLWSKNILLLKHVYCCLHKPLLSMLAALSISHISTLSVLSSSSHHFMWLCWNQSSPRLLMLVCTEAHFSDLGFNPLLQSWQPVCNKSDCRFCCSLSTICHQPLLLHVKQAQSQVRLSIAELVHFSATLQHVSQCTLAGATLLLAAGTLPCAV